MGNKTGKGKGLANRKARLVLPNLQKKERMTKMTEKKTSAAQLRAAQKYKREKVKRITVDFSPAETELWDQVSKQPNKQGYIKGLIRADMERGGEDA